MAAPISTARDTKVAMNDIIPHRSMESPGPDTVTGASCAGQSRVWRDRDYVQTKPTLAVQQQHSMNIQSL